MDKTLHVFFLYIYHVYFKVKEVISILLKYNVYFVPVWCLVVAQS